MVNPLPPAKTLVPTGNFWGFRYVLNYEGVDFLGYWLEPHRPLMPSQVSLTRLIDRSRQLHERTASITRLRQYVRRWLQWHHSGLRGLTDKRRRFEWYWRYVLDNCVVSSEG